jgi:hypothetical protein
MLSAIDITPPPIGSHCIIRRCIGDNVWLSRPYMAEALEESTGSFFGGSTQRIKNIISCGTQIDVPSWRRRRRTKRWINCRGKCLLKVPSRLVRSLVSSVWYLFVCLALFYIMFPSHDVHVMLFFEQVFISTISSRDIDCVDVLKTRQFRTNIQ